MTPIQKLEVRSSEIRSRLSQLGGMDDLSDEHRAEIDTLRKEYDINETQQRALKIAGDVPPTPTDSRTSEGRAFRELTTRANVGEIFDGILNHRALDGATAEIQQHYGIESNQVPLALLVRSWPDAEGLETRAVTPAPSNVGQNQQSIIPYVFPQSAASFLMVDMPTVGVGEAVYPVLTSALTVGTPAENADQAETTGAFSADVLSPSRIQASYFYSREDRARFAGLDASLRESLSMGLSDGFDDQILSGTNGLFTGTNLDNHAASAVTDFAAYISDFGYARVDGRYASVAGDLRMVVGSGTYAHMGSVYRNNSVDRTALDRLSDITGGIRVSAHVPGVASNKQNAVIKLGMSTGAVSPVWEGISLIPDEITKAASGQVVITAVMLHAVKVIRKASYYKKESQHA